MLNWSIVHAPRASKRKTKPSGNCVSNRPRTARPGPVSFLELIGGGHRRMLYMVTRMCPEVSDRLSFAAPSDCADAMKLFTTRRSRAELGWIALAIIWLATLIYAASGFLLGDEWVHWSQIRRFLHGDYEVYSEYLTNVPGYHWLVTGLLWPFGTDALGATRAITALMFLASGVLFYRIRRLLHPSDSQRATAQFFFLPTMFVYGFMAYTDVPALLFLLGAFLATLRHRHGISALLMLASMAMRQNNVLWVVFLAFYAAWPTLACIYVLSDSDRRTDFFWRRRVMAVLGIVWPYVLAVLCFCIYWALNGSIAYSTAQSENAHPDFRPDIGNPVFLLAIGALLFPLQIASGWARLASFGADPKRLWIWLLPVIAFLLYAQLFQVHHPFNFIVEKNLRNQILQVVAEGGAVWWLFGGLASWAFCGFIFQRWAIPQGRLWLPFSLLFVAASWMIETRYTIVPFVMFLVLRRPDGNVLERVTLVVWAVLSLWLAWHVFDQQFML